MSEPRERADRHINAKRRLLASGHVTATNRQSSLFQVCVVVAPGSDSDGNYLASAACAIAKERKRRACWRRGNEESVRDSVTGNLDRGEHSHR